MQITDIRIKKINSETNKMKGIVAVTFDNQFVVHDIKIVEHEGKMFISMPSKRNFNGEFRDIAHPIVSEFREEIQNAILKAYNELPETVQNTNEESEVEA